MKTKFSPILKIKKLQTEKLQNEIVKLQNQKKSVQNELKNLKNELKDIVPPKQGNFIQLNMTFLKSNFQQENIELKKQNILFLEEQVKLTELKYKEAMLEYEKIKHLHDLEIEKMLEKLKKDEAKNLDEIGTLLFSRKKEEK